MELSMRLCTDTCHLVGVFHRGYSVRINQKRKDEKPYKEICVVGKAPEDPRLLSLYRKHLDLYRESTELKRTTYMYQIITAKKILEREGYM